MDLEEIVKNLVLKYNIKAIGLFGSRARGDYNEYSDYDIFIISDMDIESELSLEYEFEKNLNAPIDIVRVSKNTNRILLKNIMNDAKLLYNNNNSFEELYYYVEKFFRENNDFIKMRENDLLDILK